MSAPVRIASSLVALALVVAAPGALAANGTPGRPFDDPGDWPQSGHGPEHDGYNPAETILTPKTVGGLQVHWSVQAGIGAAFEDPLISGGTVFTAKAAGSDPLAGSTVEALDAETGQPLWTFGLSTARLPHDDGIGAVSNGVAYASDSYSCGFSCRKHLLYALDASSGSILWSVEIQKPASGVVVAGSSIYVGDGSDEVALSTADGHELWRKDVGSPTVEATVGGGLVFVPAADHAVHALLASTGANAWTMPFGHPIFARVAYSGQTLFVGDGSPALTALDAQTGGTLWSVPAGSNGTPQIAVDGGRVLYGDYAGRLVALRASDGQRLWRVRLATVESDFSFPAVAGGVVYAGVSDPSAGTFVMYAVKATNGATLWSDPIASFVAEVSHGMMFASATPQREGERGTLYAFGL